MLSFAIAIFDGEVAVAVAFIVRDKDVFGSVVVIVFQSVFHAEMHKNDVF
jgi:hypothetical protein